MAKKTTEAKQTFAAAKAAAIKKRGSNFEALDIYEKGAKYTQDELNAIRVTLAKRANQRLVRLEAPTAVSKVTGESYADFGAATIAYEYIKSSRYEDGFYPEKLRFSENFGFSTDNWDIKKEIVSLQKFLRSKSSQVKGQKAIEKKRIETFKSGSWGTGKKSRGLKTADTKEFYNFLNSDVFHDLVNVGLTSEDIVEVYDKARDNKSHDEIMDKMETALDTYREKGNVSFKDFTKRLLPGSGNS